MYLDHFRLDEPPFSLTPDTAYFMGRAGYQDALNVLLVALRSGEGFVKVTGEVGTGKTMLCRALMSALGDDFQIAYIPNPYLRPTTLMLSIADELGIEYPEQIGQHAFMRRFNKALLAIHSTGKRVVVCLDESQALPVETLESLRLITNLETEKSKLVQVVLFGQPELDTVLDEPSIRQLRQRITFSYEIKPLTRPGVDQYLRHRVEVAGFRGNALFTKRARDALYRGSHGIPRLINIIAHKSLMLAFGAGDFAVDKKYVTRAIADTEDARRASGLNSRASRWRWLWRRAPSIGAYAALCAGLSAGYSGVF